MAGAAVTIAASDGKCRRGPVAACRRAQQRGATGYAHRLEGTGTVWTDFATGTDTPRQEDRHWRIRRIAPRSVRGSSLTTLPGTYTSTPSPAPAPRRSTPTAASYVSGYPYETQRTPTSNLDFTAGRSVPHLVIAPVKDGKVTFCNHAGSVDLLADITGYYTG